MDDNTKGTKTNRVTLNIGQVAGTAPPEPGIAPVVIDGTPIHAVRHLQIDAGIDRVTTCIISFECEVSGFVDNVNIKDVLKRKAN
jgi:hypothetical protein